MALIPKTGDQLVVLRGCCHIDLLNTVAYLQRVFMRTIVPIGGGLPLTSATVEDL